MNTPEMITTQQESEEYYHEIQKQKWREYSKRPEVKERQKQYNQSPKVREYKREYWRREEVKQRKREQIRKPEFIKSKRDYDSFQITLKRAVKDSYQTIISNLLE